TTNVTTMEANATTTKANATANATRAATTATANKTTGTESATANGTKATIASKNYKPAKTVNMTIVRSVYFLLFRNARSPARVSKLRKAYRNDVVDGNRLRKSSSKQPSDLREINGWYTL
ncbi:13329_t:CDS:2, partial [Racocetra persica]